MNIEQSVAIVTGGASGLGAACVRKLSQLGASVAILDLAEEQGNLLATELGDKVIFCKTDVTDEASVAKAIEGAVGAFGTIHAALNCAGVGTAGRLVSRKGPIPMADFNRVVNINLTGTVIVARLAVQQMMKNEPSESGERGVLINTASVAAFDGQIGQAAYAASKAAVAGLTLPLARELAPQGIRVLTIAPGLFDTPMAAGIPDNFKAALTESIPFPHRFGGPHEFADLAAHILENAYLNGTTIRLDAALRMPPK